MSFSACPRCAAPVLARPSACPSCHAALSDGGEIRALPAILAGLLAGCDAKETKGDGIDANCDGEDDT